MKNQPFRKIIVFGINLLLFAIPALVSAQSRQSKQSQPPIASPLVREGGFVVELVSALGVGATADEVEAESLLGGTGITL